MPYYVLPIVIKKERNSCKLDAMNIAQEDDSVLVLKDLFHRIPDILERQLTDCIYKHVWSNL